MTIHKLLIANRGEIASRVMRSAHDLDITSVAVFSDADADAPFVADADEAVHLPGNAPGETYLQADRIIEAARQTGADAIHPGYGFLSENADFARACGEAGIIFVGPPPEAIESMGSKVTAKQLMQDASVPVLPGITIDNDTAIDPTALSQQVADEIGFPMLVKASYGGGGRGMRSVASKDELIDGVDSARREAASAFGNATVFLERLVEQPRHVEVQIFGDSHGSVVHLFERECSIQRRYQKIIEESPSPVVNDELRAELGQAAVAAGQALGYVGAGTVEFVLAPDGRFYFLEVNTRLQVEHPVTEKITGLDLVRLQLLVAEGDPLPAEAFTPSVHGHAVEVRLYAEDVAAGFLPSTGRIHRFEIPDLRGLRVDAGVASGGEVSVHYDPMLAKVIAHGGNRDEACRTLARALSESQLHGVITNRDLLVGILREPEFRAGQTDTGYLGRHEPKTLMTSGRDPAIDPIHAVAAALAAQAQRRRTAPVLDSLPSGWRNVPNAMQQTTFSLNEETLDVRYQVSPAPKAAVNGTPLTELRLRSATQQSVDLEVAGVRRRISVHRADDVFYVDSVLGSTTLVEQPRFPDPQARTAAGSLLAPMPGTVVRVPAESGQAVIQGEPVVVLEAMKMEHTVAAPHDGTVNEMNVSEGETVDIGAVLAVVEGDAQ